jgi:hypothetical protein
MYLLLLHLVVLTAVRHALLGLPAQRTDQCAVPGSLQQGAVQHSGLHAAAMVTAVGMATYYAVGHHLGPTTLLRQGL